MSSGTNNFTATPGDRRTGRDNNTYNISPAVFLPYPALPGANTGTWRARERVLAGPLAMGVGFPVHSAMQILMVNTAGASREPRAPQNLQHFQAAAAAQAQAPSLENSILSHEQHDDRARNAAALKKLRKEIYNPVPKKMTSRLCVYYRDRALDVLKEREALKAKEDDQEGKRCAVCLEDFEPKECVMLTPCNHMFHEECIVPWVKSNGKCPVCRFAFSDQVGSRRSVTNTNDVLNDLEEGDLISVIRAMEEAFIPSHTARSW